jgi:hypothetical protein
MKEEHYDKIFPFLEDLGIKIHKIAMDEHEELNDVIKLQTTLIYESCKILLQAHDHAVSGALGDMKEDYQLLIDTLGI